MSEPDRGGNLRRGLPGQGQTDQRNSRPQKVEDGTRERGIPNHVTTRDQHTAYIAGGNFNLDCVMSVLSGE